jgi:hypothetical protein
MAWDASIFMSRQGAHAEPVPSRGHVCIPNVEAVVEVLIPTRYVTSTYSLYCNCTANTAAAGRIFNPPKLRCCDGFPIRYHPIGKLLVDSYLGGPHGTPVVYPDDGSAPLARGFSI